MMSSESSSEKVGLLDAGIPRGTPAGDKFVVILGEGFGDGFHFILGVCSINVTGLPCAPRPKLSEVVDHRKRKKHRTVLKIQGPTPIEAHVGVPYIP